MAACKSGYLRDLREESSFGGISEKMAAHPAMARLMIRVACQTIKL